MLTEGRRESKDLSLAADVQSRSGELSPLPPALLLSIQPYFPSLPPEVFTALCSPPFNLQGRSRSCSQEPTARTCDRRRCLSTVHQECLPLLLWWVGDRRPEGRPGIAHMPLKKPGHVSSAKLLHSQTHSSLASLCWHAVSCCRLLCADALLSFDLLCQAHAHLKNKGPSSAKCLFQCNLQGCLRASREIKPQESPSPCLSQASPPSPGRRQALEVCTEQPVHAVGPGPERAGRQGEGSMPAQ